MTPEPDTKKLLFDEKINAVFRPAINDAFAAVPELRSVVVVYDYYGRLNDAQDIGKGMWLSADGSSPRPSDAIVGSIASTLQCLAHMLDDAFQMVGQLNQEYVDVSRKLLEAKEALSSVTGSTPGADAQAPGQVTNGSAKTSF